MKLDHSGLVLGGFLVASFTAAAIGGTATGRAVQDWYPTLTKPAWNRCASAAKRRPVSRARPGNAEPDGARRRPVQNIAIPGSGGCG